MSSHGPEPWPPRPSLAAPAPARPSSRGQEKLRARGRSGLLPRGVSGAHGAAGSTDPGGRWAVSWLASLHKAGDLPILEGRAQSRQPWELPRLCPARWAGLLGGLGSGVKGRLTILHSRHPSPSGGSPVVPRPRAVSPLHSLAPGAPGITSLHVDQAAYRGAGWQVCVQTRDTRPLLCPSRGTDPSPAGSQLHPEAPLGQG